MPSGLLNADIGFPAFTGNESTEEKIGQISQYLYMLLEQLKYSLANIGVDNMTSGGVTELTQTVVNTPININIGDTSGKSTTIGESIARNGENISAVAQTADKINLVVQNGSSASELVLTPGMTGIISDQIVANGKMIFASKNDLKEGKTEIDGACIKSGTLILDSPSTANDSMKMEGGKLTAYHPNIYYPSLITTDLELYASWGHAYLSVTGEMSFNSSSHMSIGSTGGGVTISAATTLDLEGGLGAYQGVVIGGRNQDVRITGNVYINGVLQ